MISVPVLCDDTIDILDISAKMRRGHGDLSVSGPISSEVEDEIQKSIQCATVLSSLGEFPLPDLSTLDLHISFSCRITNLPVSGHSYGLGLGVELLRLFSRRSWSAHICYTGGLSADGSINSVGGTEQKIIGAIERGFNEIFLPASQLSFLPLQIVQHPCSDIYEVWSILTYGGDKCPPQ